MVIIRQHEERDLPALRALLAEQQAVEHALDDTIREPSESVMNRYFGEMLGWLSELDGTIFVAESEGVVVGFATVLIIIKDEIWTTISRSAYITNIDIREAHRGEGIAQRLMQAAEDYARQKGCDHLLLDVLNENAPALKAYERFGFRRREIEMHKRLL